MHHLVSALLIVLALFGVLVAVGSEIELNTPPAAVTAQD